MKISRYQRGFSLVELSVSLAIMGAMGLAVWQLIPASRNIAEGQPAAVQLEQAHAALEGFVLSRHRLPCPDVDNDGREDCAAGGRGQLAWRDLGLTQKFSILRYGVYRSGANDLTQALARQTALLPPGYSASVINGLDLCVALRAAAFSPGVLPLTAGTVPVAYVLAHPGKDALFQGLNVAAFDMPGRPSSPTYDDSVLATGLSELSGRLSCPARLGEANTAARAAFVAFDLDRNMAEFLDFRNFAYSVAVTNRNFAIANVSMATVLTIIAAADAVTAVAIAGNSAGAGAGVIALAALPVGFAAAALAGASVQLSQAIVAEVKAQAQVTGALQLKVASAAALVQAGAAAISVDLKGLNP